MRLDAETDRAELRRAWKLSPAEIGQILLVGYCSVSTRRRVIEAIGGKLDIVARYADHAVWIRNLADLDGKERV